MAYPIYLRKTSDITATDNAIDVINRYNEYLIYDSFVNIERTIIINSRIDGININNISIRILQWVGLKSVPFKQRKIV
ncbi:hypothetical protein HH195_11655 (plasmid) [Sarcina sp. JB2]|uniref:Uncharacterized protein n=1 Tax=Candidatus Sarcina troglodytae TaxID=2726954 RepID=A0ACD1BGM5_9CLOT|nr:hypothetical protein [Sarcina sp. JB2]QPJ86616.1 hypothetical protein HH195_11655 [Sarcina sp. JB2]